MFRFFKKREKPPFEELTNSPFKEKYFVRLAPWAWLNEETIHVFDLNSPRIITMDPWIQLVYLEADGQKTIYQFVHQMAAKYSFEEKIPAELDKTILQMMGNLLNDKLIELSDVKKNLPQHIKKPRHER